ncbi:hypothetical protein [Legionella beliardensis]|nr:hypothetical protein [Legionella beliardensis]
MMSDFKSKLPSFQEVTHIVGKLFKDVKNSVSEIIDEYKQKRTQEEYTARASSDNVTASNSSTPGQDKATTQSTPATNQGSVDTTTAASADSVASSTTTSSATPIETQTIQSLDEPPVVSKSALNLDEKSNNPKKRTKGPVKENISVEDSFAGQNTDKKASDPTDTNPEVNIEHHVDEQKPLKDDVL